MKRQKKRDPALFCSNPRLISAIYFGLLSVVGTILINALLTSIGFEEKIPLFQAILLGMIIASCAGALFGEQIVHCPPPYKTRTFILGFIMVIASLPVFVLGLVFFMKGTDTNLLAISQAHNMIYYYLYILAYSYIIFGLLLAVGSGLAAMYLRGQLVYDILNTYKPDKGLTKLPESPLEKNKIQTSDSVRITHQ